MRARFRVHKREKEIYGTNGRNACVTYARDNFKSAARSGEMSQSVSKSNKLKVMEYRYRELNVIPGGITWDRIFFFFFHVFRYFSLRWNDTVVVIARFECTTKNLRWKHACKFLIKITGRTNGNVIREIRFVALFSFSKHRNCECNA